MPPASLSVKVFGAYVSLTGIGLLVAPALVLSLLGITAPTEVWIRVVGALATVLGSYYWVCGAAGDVTFMRVTVFGRFVFAALCLALVLAVSAPWQLLLFGVVDIAGALWTSHGLRKPA